MAEIKWIKLTVDMFDDEKIRLIQAMPEADAIIIVWIRLLSLAGKTNTKGQIHISQDMAYTDEMLATLFNKSLNIVRLAIETLKKFEMIEVAEDGMIFISNWEKHQNVEGMEKVREQNRLRKKKQRNKAISDTSHVMSRDSHATELELDIELDKNKSKNNFFKPSETEKNEIEKPTTKTAESPRVIFDFYEQNGFGILAPFTIEKITKWIDDFKEAGSSEPEKLIIKALEISVDSNVRKWNYAESILKDWESRKLLTVKDVETSRQSYQSKPKHANSNGIQEDHPFTRDDDTYTKDYGF